MSVSLCVSVFFCALVCVLVCLCAVYVCVSFCVWVCVCACMCVYTCAPVCKCVCISVPACECVCACTCSCLYACLHTCAVRCVRVWCVQYLTYSTGREGERSTGLRCRPHCSRPDGERQISPSEKANTAVTSVQAQQSKKLQLQALIPPNVIHQRNLITPVCL